MRGSLWLAVLVLAACGGGGSSEDDVRRGPDGLPIGPPPSRIVHVVTVASFDDDPGRLGDYQQVGQDGRVRIRDDVLLAAPEVAVRTIMHELGHAMGLSHLPGTGCIMDSIGGAGLTPCAAELAGLAAGSVTVYAGATPGLYNRVRSAAGDWNGPAGRVVFLVP